MVVSLQVRANFRTAITIPEQSWGRFRDVVNTFMKEAAVVKKDVKEDEDVAK